MYSHFQSVYLSFKQGVFEKIMSIQFAILALFSLELYICKLGVSAARHYFGYKECSFLRVYVPTEHHMVGCCL